MTALLPAEDLRQLSDEQLSHLRAAHVRSRFQARLERVIAGKNLSGTVRNDRKMIARINTILAERSRLHDGMISFTEETIAMGDSLTSYGREFRDARGAIQARMLVWQEHGLAEVSWRSPVSWHLALPQFRALSTRLNPDFGRVAFDVLERETLKPTQADHDIAEAIVKSEWSRSSSVGLLSSSGDLFFIRLKGRSTNVRCHVLASKVGQATLALTMELFRPPCLQSQAEDQGLSSTMSERMLATFERARIADEP